MHALLNCSAQQQLKDTSHTQHTHTGAPLDTPRGISKIPQSCGCCFRGPIITHAPRVMGRHSDWVAVQSQRVPFRRPAGARQQQTYEGGDYRPEQTLYHFLNLFTLLIPIPSLSLPAALQRPAKYSDSFSFISSFAPLMLSSACFAYARESLLLLPDQYPNPGTSPYPFPVWHLPYSCFQHFC